MKKFFFFFFFFCLKKKESDAGGLNWRARVTRTSFFFFWPYTNSPNSPSVQIIDNLLYFIRIISNENFAWNMPTAARIHKKSCAAPYLKRSLSFVLWCERRHGKHTAGKKKRQPNLKFTGQRPKPEQYLNPSTCCQRHILFRRFRLCCLYHTEMCK